MEIFNTLHARGHTIIMVTHDAHVARYAKQTIFFRDGMIVEKNSVSGEVSV